MEPRGLRAESERRRSLSAVLTAVHRSGRLSRAQLAALTGLRAGAITDLVAELVEAGLVEHGEPVGRGSPGRPSPSVQPRAGGPAILAARIDVATVALAVAGLGGRLSAPAVRERAAARRSPAATAEQLGRLVAEALAGPASGRRVLGLGLAVPGIVRREDGLVHLAPNLGWHDVAFAELLDEHLPAGLPVLLANDGDLGAVAEHLRGAGAGVDDLVYLHGGVGVAGGVVSAGALHRGAAGYAGELGHLVVNPKGQPCACGGSGCLETEVGQGILLRRLGRGGQPEAAAVSGVLADAAAGDGEVLAALAEVGAWLGRGVASLVNVLNPSRIVLDGFFAAAHPHIVEPLRRELDHHAQWPNRSVVSVVPAALGSEAMLRGAAELALGPVLADPAAAGP